jgi:hypothetical protein
MCWTTAAPTGTCIIAGVNVNLCQQTILSRLYFICVIHLYLSNQADRNSSCDMSFCSIYVQKYFYSCYVVTEAAPVCLECALAKLLLPMLLYPLVAIWNLMMGFLDSNLVSYSALWLLYFVWVDGCLCMTDAPCRNLLGSSWLFQQQDFRLFGVSWEPSERNSYQTDHRGRHYFILTGAFEVRSSAWLHCTPSLA